MVEQQQQNCIIKCYCYPTTNVGGARTSYRYV